MASTATHATQRDIGNGLLPPGVSLEAVKVQLEKILASETFVHTEQLSDFLRFAVEKVIQGQKEQLKEYTLGVEVFHRGDSFDPRTDPIVRVQAGRLRSKLRDYYDAEGREDRVWIGLSKRGYVPVIQKHRKDESGKHAAKSRREPTLPEKPKKLITIAVLPLTNLSGDEETGYLADGIMEDLIAQLSKIRDLGVISRTSSMRYKDSGKDIRQIATELGVGAVLESSIRRSGEQVLIVTHLIDARTDQHLWGATFDRKLTEIIGIEGDVALRIAAALNAELSAEQQRAIRKKITDSYEAYDLFLRGRYHLRKTSEEETLAAIRYFEQAIREDPRFAKAYAGLAISYCAFVYRRHGCPNECLPKAAEAIKKALSLDKTLAEAHTSLGFERALSFDWLGAEKAFRRAIVLNSDHAPARHGYGAYLGFQGRFEEGLAELQRAQELDPFSPHVSFQIAMNYQWRGQYGLALKQLYRTIELDPTWANARVALALALAHNQRTEEAIAAADALGDPSEVMPLAAGLLGCLYAKTGQAAKARSLLEKLKRETQRIYAVPFNIALISASLGESELALESLEQAYEQHDPWVVTAKVAPVWDPLRGDPRFEALLRKLGLRE